MAEKFLRFLKGYVKVQVSGDSPERFLNLCSHHQITIWGLKSCRSCYEMYLPLSEFRKIRPLARKAHIRVRIKTRVGLPFRLLEYRKRACFFLGAFFCICLLFFYTSFVWDIHFEGNETWTDETLLGFLKEEAITPGMPKGKVDCAAIVQKIRQEYGEIVWVSASIEGSRLLIQIKENEDTIQEILEEEKPCDLIAKKDGVITDIITRSGVPMVHVGDRVKKGDLLVSGRVEVCNDAGEVEAYQYCRADADIFADTTWEYEDTVGTYYKEKTYEKKKRFQGFFRFGNWKISLGRERPSVQNWEQHTMQRQIRLGENFRLPVYYGMKIAKSYEVKVKRYTKTEIRQKLSENFKQFSREFKEKGIQIQENSVKIHIGKKSAVAKGTLFLNEPVGETADTEILEVEREKKNESFGTDDGDAGGT
ncbi:MAG: sporulation protein YqfD [[Ruminococcus] gnavus]|nr:sporulation protein YqfD [Mediterraneibacter gnavus]